MATPPPPAAARSLWAWLVALLFAVLAIVGFAWAVSERNKGPETAKVPNLIGRSRLEATSAVQDRGFRPKIDSRASYEPEGTVLDQAPGPRVALEKNAAVRIVVSAGPPSVSIPNVIGVKSAGATRLLTTLHLAPQPRVVASNKPAGTVIAQNPPAGEKVSKGTVVFFNVSKGPQLVTVPALRGLTAKRADAAIRKLGLKSNDRLVASGETPGTVVAQSPQRGAKVKPGSIVQVNISRGTGLITVPALRGLSQAAAVARVKNAGLVPVVTQVASAAPAGRVVAQDPGRGLGVKKGSQVRINVSNGQGAPSATTTAATTTTTTP